MVEVTISVCDVQSSHCSEGPCRIVLPVTGMRRLCEPFTKAPVRPTTNSTKWNELQEYSGFKQFLDAGTITERVLTGTTFRPICQELQSYTSSWP